MTKTREIVLDRERVDSLPWQPFGKAPGVTQRTLWHDAAGRAFACIMHLEPGATVPQHTHRASTHHVWVVSGTCEVEGCSLTAGSYLFVPAMIDHGIHRAGPSGCTLFCLYLPTDNA